MSEAACGEQRVGHGCEVVESVLLHVCSHVERTVPGVWLALLSDVTQDFLHLNNPTMVSLTACGASCAPRFRSTDGNSDLLGTPGGPADHGKEQKQTDLTT